MTTNRETLSSKSACVIVAGGMGMRVGGETPKQFMELCGEPVLIHTVRSLVKSGFFQRVVVVVPQAWVTRTVELLGEADFSGVAVVAGGMRRQDSVRAGLSACGDCEIVAVHDGARPFPPRNMHDCITAAQEIGGAIFAMPVTDTLKRASDKQIAKSVEREDLWAAQTPQIFRLGLLADALDYCDNAEIDLTDDASAFEHKGWPVAIIPGSRTNIKITYQEDFDLAEFLISRGNE